MAPRAAAAWTSYVLHQHAWSESSLIIEAFTREAGRVVLVAKGAKRPYSQMRAVLLPFQRLALVPTRSAARNADAQSGDEIANLRHAEWAASHPLPKGGALFSGFYLNELVLKLLARQDPHPALFDAYALAISQLAATPDGEEGPVLRAFEWQLLRELGLLPALDQDTLTGEPLAPDSTYRLHAETGVTRLAGSADLHAIPGVSGARLLAIEQALASPQPALRMTRLVSACAEGDADLKPALRQVLHYHLGVPRLRTRELMQDLQRLNTRPAPHGLSDAASSLQPDPNALRA